MFQSDSVTFPCSSAASRRKSFRSSFADSRSILATSEVGTTSPRPFEIKCLERSRNSRRPSEIRMDRVCCWGHPQGRYSEAFPLRSGKLLYFCTASVEERALGQRRSTFG